MEKSNVPDYAGIMESLSDALVVIGLDKRVVSINSAAATLFGFSEEEVQGMRCRDVVRCALCGDPCPFEESIERRDTVANFNINLVGGPKSGTPVCMHTSPLENQSGEISGVIENIRVITHIRELIEDLEGAYSQVESEKKRVEAILNSISEAVITIDSEWRITSFNRSAEELTGVSAREALGKLCRDVMGVNLCPKNCPMEETLRTGKPRTNIETIVTSREGKIVPVSVSTALFMDEGGEILGGVETYRNLEEIEIIAQKRKSRFPYKEIVGKSPAIKQIFELIDVIKDTDSTVLITGESGVGKELFARAIHDLSSRRNGPFVKVNCAALTETLLESELFGHVKGAFTGAISDKVGRFEAADGGTIFLDEIGDVPLPIQVKLLRVLQDHEFEKVGSSKTVKVDVRVIAATNRDLKKLMKEGKFREDLYYRLNVIPIHIPPLRERVDDIPALVEHIIENLRRRGIEKVKKVSPDAMRCLMTYPWPGNVRELENILERAAVVCTTGVIDVSDLADEVLEYCKGRKGVKTAGLDVSEVGERESAGVHVSGELGEKERILAALEKHRWKRGETARELGMDRTTLWRKMKKFGLI